MERWRAKSARHARARCRARSTGPAPCRRFPDLEAKISPEPSQEEAWRTFENALRTSAGVVERACVEDPPRPLSADAGERLKRMERHAAAMQAMFGAMADAYVAIAPNLTEAQRDILSRNIVPSRPFAARFLGGKGPRPVDTARNCGQGEPGFPRLSAASGSFAVLISLIALPFCRVERAHDVDTRPGK